jgi:hypothetical protein
MNSSHLWGKTKAIALIYMEKAMLWSEEVLIPVDDFETCKASSISSSMTWVFFGSNLVVWAESRTLTRSTYFQHMMLSHSLGGKGRHPGVDKMSLTTIFGSEAKFSSCLYVSRISCSKEASAVDLLFDQGNLSKSTVFAHFDWGSPSSSETETSLDCL